MEFIYKINEEIEKYKYKIVYGSGIAAIELYMKSVEQCGQINFYDEEEFVIGKKILNKEIITLKKVAELGDEACLIVCEEYMPEITEKLKRLNIKHVYVWFGGANKCI